MRLEERVPGVSVSAFIGIDIDADLARGDQLNG